MLFTRLSDLDEYFFVQETDSIYTLEIELIDPPQTQPLTFVLAVEVDPDNEDLAVEGVDFTMPKTAIIPAGATSVSVELKAISKSFKKMQQKGKS